MGWPFSSPRDFPNLGVESGSPASQADSLLSEPPGLQLFKNRTQRHREEAISIIQGLLITYL